MSVQFVLIIQYTEPSFYLQWSNRGCPMSYYGDLHNDVTNVLSSNVVLQCTYYIIKRMAGRTEAEGALVSILKFPWPKGVIFLTTCIHFYCIFVPIRNNKGPKWQVSNFIFNNVLVTYLHNIHSIFNEVLLKIPIKRFWKQ